MTVGVFENFIGLEMVGTMLFGNGIVQKILDCAEIIIFCSFH